MKSAPRKRPRQRPTPPPMASLSGVPRVLLLVETSDGYGRRILEGVGRYVREHGPWSLYFETRGLDDRLGQAAIHWRGDGILARTTSAGMAGRLRATGVPMIELLGQEPDEPAKVHGENASAGRLAAEHLLGCGLRHFGFFAFGEAWWIAAYREGFQRTLELHKFACDGLPPAATKRPHLAQMARRHAARCHGLDAVTREAGGRVCAFHRLRRHSVRPVPQYGHRRARGNCRGGRGR